MVSRNHEVLIIKTWIIHKMYIAAVSAFIHILLHIPTRKYNVVLASHFTCLNYVNNSYRTPMKLVSLSHIISNKKNQTVPVSYIDSTMKHVRLRYIVHTVINVCIVVWHATYW